MYILSLILVGFVVLIHIYILVLEMFLWTKPLGRKAFGMTQEFADSTKVLAANQGLYNGFLAAGLIWGLCLNSQSIQMFFLACVAIAGIFGAATASKKILYIQTVPAVMAALTVYFI
jgi:putative membrane protein